MRRAAALLTAVALAASACGGLSTKEDAARTQAEEEADRSYGGDVVVGDPSPDGAATEPVAATAATLKVRIRNAEGRTTAGIPLRYDGPERGTVTTDRRGVAAATIPAGTYEISVAAGCGDEVQVFKGAGGTAGLPAGETVSIDLTVDWRRRIAPWPTVEVRDANPFPRGKPVTLRYLVQDRCEAADAPGVSFPRWVLDPGRGIALDEAPVMRAASDGYASVVVRCTAAGNPALVIRDRDNSEDRFDLLAVRAPPDPSRPWCA